ncbi:hypothetical protein PGUG_03626 [Meyerozyma guilliermondii ATCC 6260]|uniref:N-(5'-phosphoribosyl)anthranilate isomerase n=1 Tax=Meyerozyma guilliermondii (strain ATCC 6260 / CBS 566 / DSM 6381 / JCM 1539 / NBRC 10279 / NRRL Y-324) TaxID=294746 RepID=A5DK25_PICGU|nr:uncharacterized protein PGUG_03626 [Meyerozyma guilliermondii ATCC 6260]EDK39528.2 hypothetical protein PGUG_03626 [Meyerozyma guilliermondii ATCC 6260]
MKLAKICGIKTTAAAEKAIDSNADLLGMIMVPNRKRTIDKNVALQVTELVKNRRKDTKRQIQTASQLIKHIENDTFSSIDELLSKFKVLIQENGPFSVGVFRNQSIEEVFKTANELDLDIIQLHGSEDKPEFVKYNSKNEKFVIIGRYVVPSDVPNLEPMFESLLKDGKYVGGGLSIPLLDSEAGGEGITIDWDAVGGISKGIFLLAGGLNSDNLKDTSHLKNVIGYDVSGGVEDGEGHKDFTKIENFIKVAHSI